MTRRLVDRCVDANGGGSACPAAAEGRGGPAEHEAAVAAVYGGAPQDFGNVLQMNAGSSQASGTARAALILGALGVVFGDIGTSPIYTIQTVFNPGDPHPVPVSADSVFGIVSMIFWSVLIVVTITYVLLVMRADNHGEGGIMALITLVRRTSMGRERTKWLLAGLGIFGASLFLGDSMITPAISVLSAVEGAQGCGAVAGADGGTDHRRDHHRPVPVAADRYSGGRPAVRPRDARVVSRPSQRAG